MNWRAVIVIALSVLFLAIVTPSMFARFTTAYTGAHVDGTRVIAVDAGSPAERGGLRTGDLIGCIDTRDYAILRLPFSQEAAYEPDLIHLCVTNAAPGETLRLPPCRDQSPRRSMEAPRCRLSVCFRMRCSYSLVAL